MSDARALIETQQRWAELAEREVLTLVGTTDRERIARALRTLDQAMGIRASLRGTQVMADDEPTDPRALTLRECAVCGHPTPGEWTPPSG